jgi:hypothetical protein
MHMSASPFSRASDYQCTTDCQLSNAQLLDFPAAQSYVVDITVKNLDLVFRGNFE